MTTELHEILRWQAFDEWLVGLRSWFTDHPEHALSNMEGAD